MSGSTPTILIYTTTVEVYTTTVSISNYTVEFSTSVTPISPGFASISTLHDQVQKLKKEAVRRGGLLSIRNLAAIFSTNNWIASILIVMAEFQPIGLEFQRNTVEFQRLDHELTFQSLY